MLTFIQLGPSQYYLFCSICNKTNLSQFRYYIKEKDDGKFYCKKCKEKIENGEINEQV